MKVQYEWTVEVIDADGDIVQSEFSNTLLGLPAFVERHDIGLVRDEIESDGNLGDREWAYIVNGKMSKFFQDCYGKATRPVPQKYLKEFEKFTESVVHA